MVTSGPPSHIYLPPNVQTDSCHSQSIKVWKSNFNLASAFSASMRLQWLHLTSHRWWPDLDAMILPERERNRMHDNISKEFGTSRSCEKNAENFHQSEQTITTLLRPRDWHRRWQLPSFFFHSKSARTHIGQSIDANLIFLFPSTTLNCVDKCGRVYVCLCGNFISIDQFVCDPFNQSQHFSAHIVGDVAVGSCPMVSLQWIVISLKIDFFSVFVRT